LIFKDLQLYVKSIGEINLRRKGDREILVILLVNNEVNIGVLILQMSKFAERIRNAIKRNNKIMSKLEMTESELKEHIKNLKRKVFGST
ncbi:MAG: hypothetical protein ACFE8J_04480, partial [Candidatus Heimdallarchaeota archaeon]